MGDTLVAVIIAEDTDRIEGWQYSGALIYDLKAPNSSPKQRIPLIGRIIADSRAVDVMSTHEGIILNHDGMHLVTTGPGDGGMLMETCRSIIAMDRANNGEGEPMGSQIYETFLRRENKNHRASP